MTKNNPGAFDCYKNADPDEPMFILLARDPCAPMLVGLWAAMRVTLEKNKAEDAQIGEAIDCSDAMAHWANKHRRGMTSDMVSKVMEALAISAAAMISEE